MISVVQCCRVVVVIVVVMVVMCVCVKDCEHVWRGYEASECTANPVSSHTCPLCRLSSIDADDDDGGEESSSS